MACEYNMIGQTLFSDCRIQFFKILPFFLLHPPGDQTGDRIAFVNKLFNYADKMSPLGNASADDCASYCVTLFSDLTKMVTMQNLFHDGGFSTMGMNPAILDMED